MLGHVVSQRSAHPIVTSAQREGCLVFTIYPLYVYMYLPSPTGWLWLERSFQAALSAALACSGCCPTSPEDATYIRQRGTSRARYILQLSSWTDGGRREARATGSWSLDFAYAVSNPTLDPRDVGVTSHAVTSIFTITVLRVHKS